MALALPGLGAGGRDGLQRPLLRPRLPLRAGLAVADRGHLDRGDRRGQAGRLGHRLCRPGRLLQPGRPARPGRPATPLSIAAHLGWLLLVLVAAEVATAGRQRRQAAERTRAEEARRRAGEERMRIARELHDVLAHNISLINVQAGVALHLMDEQPGQSRTALVAIKQASNDALGELRSVLDVLRQGDEAEPRSPASGLAQLDSLVAGRPRPAWRCAPGSRAPPAPAGRDRPGRLPDRAGVADQRDPPRRPGGQRHRPDRLWRGRAGGGGHGRRPRGGRRQRLGRPPVDDQQTPTGRFAGRADQAGAWSACASGWPPSAASSPPDPARRRVRVVARLPLDHEGSTA